MMRIVQISTADIQGGASRAAFRLYQGLARLGQDSSMLVKTRLSHESRVFRIELEDGGQTDASLEDLRLAQKYGIDQGRTEISNTYFSLPAPGFDISGHAQIVRGDVLNLHWVGGLLSPGSIARLQALKKTLVWTLHDQRAFTGGCHFSGGCQGYESTCANCPQLQSDLSGVADAALRDAGEAIRPEGLVVVSPSRWLADCARRSSLLRGARIEVIPNGVDTAVFRPQLKAEARARLGLKEGPVYLLVGADNLQEKRKGYQALRRALECCGDSPAWAAALRSGQVRLMSFGDHGEMAGLLGLPVQSFGRIDSDETLAGVYAAADAFLLPSSEDNLPNTMLESMCCGTPVLAFNIGGMPDLIIPEETGLLAPAGDVQGFALALQRVMEPGLRGRLSENCVRTIPSRFSIEVQARRYLDLYLSQSLADHAGVTAARPGPSPLMPLGPAFASILPDLLVKAKIARRAGPWKKVRGLARRVLRVRGKGPSGESAP